MRLYSYILFMICICTESLSQNCYPINTLMTDPDDSSIGFGFVVYETSDELYLLTAKHVVVPTCTNCTVKEITVIISGQKNIAAVFNIHPTEDMAIIVIKRPAGYSQDNVYLLIDVKKGDDVYIEGRFGYVNRSNTGPVSSVSDKYIEAEIGSVAVGSSGGPLIKGKTGILNEKIVGLVIKDDGQKIIALPSGVIKNYINEVFVKALNLKMNAFPIIMFGAMGIGAIGNNFWGTREDYYKELPFGYGFYIDISAFKSFTVSYQYSRLSISMQTYSPYLPDNRYKNYINKHCFIFRYNTVPIPLITTPFFFIGVSKGKIDPEINLENAGWTPLSSLGHQYSNDFYSTKMGLGVHSKLIKNTTFGLTLDFEYYFNKYASFNLFEPYSSSFKGMYINLNLFLGFSIGPRGSKTKILQ
jgi:hypothetical protein